MSRPNDEANHQELGFLIASLASRCGLIEDEIGGNQELEDSEQKSGQDSAQDSRIARSVHAQDAVKGLSSAQLDLMKSVANELIRERGSVNACLESLSLIGQDDTQRTMLRTRRDPKKEQSKNQSTQLASNYENRFQVQRFLAKGGIGQVSIAIDKQLNREVAFKEIRSDRTSDKKLHGRFLVEAEVTGRLEHPGVVPVYSLGANQDGLPFYAMRFIRGKSLSNAIRNYHQGTKTNEHSDSAGEFNRQILFRKLLQNFVSVCNTLHYAHDRGVVHRDIKPDNIMIGTFGETLVVDWGIAKTGVENSSPSSEDPAAICEQDRNLIPQLTSNKVTQQGDIMGTPGFMSPEQILGWQDRINACSDVYSLGATLYTLLTGRPPFESVRLPDLSVQVLEGTVKPPRQLNSEVPPALEAIALKAMAPKQSHRYESSVELANDIEAWLADEPTTAYRDPFWHRVKRWLKRHPAIASGTAATIALTIAGLITGLAIVGGFNRKLETSNNQLEEANRLALSEKSRAENNFGIAQSAVDKYLTQVSASPTLGSPAFLDIRTSLLKTAIPFYEEFLRQNPDDRALASSRGGALARLGNIWQLESDHEKAIEHFQQAIDLFEELGLQRNINQSEADLNLLALQGCWLNIASSQSGIGQPAQAIASTKKSLGILESLLKTKRFQKPENQNESTLVDEDQDAFTPESELVNYELLRTRMATCYSNLGAFYFASNQFEKSAEHSLKAVETIRELDKGPANQYRLASSLNNLGVMANTKEEWRKAWEYLDESFQVASKLVTDFPGATDYREQLSQTLHNVAKTFQGWGHQSDAIANFNAALVHERWLATNYPTVPGYRNSLASTLNDYANMLIGDSQMEKARPLLEEGSAVARELADEYRSVPKYKVELANTVGSMGLLNLDLKKWQEAEKHFLESREIWQQLVAATPEQHYYPIGQSRIEVNLGINEQEQGNFEKALDWFDKANMTLDASSDSTRILYQRMRMRVYWGIAESNEGLGRFELAANAWKQAVDYALTPTEKQIRQMRLAMALAHSGQLQELNLVEESLAAFPNQQSETYYRIARAFAICGAQLDSGSSDFNEAADQCLQALTRAKEMGHFKEAASSKRFNDDKVFEAFDSLKEFEQFKEQL